MANPVSPCSGVCSLLFHERSVNVRFNGTCHTPYHTRVYDCFKYCCSFCSVVLYPFRCFTSYFMVFGYSFRPSSFYPAGSKVGEQNEHDKDKYSQYLINKGLEDNQPTRTKPEQNPNSVPNTSINIDVPTSNREATATKAVRLAVRLGSVLFGYRPNRSTPLIPRHTEQFYPSVRYVRSFIPLSDNPVWRTP